MADTLVTPVSAAGAPPSLTAVLAARLDRLATRLAAATGVDGESVAEARDLAALAGGLDPYLDRHTTPGSAALTRLASRAGVGPDAPGAAASTAHVEGRFLTLLVHLARASSVLVIGLPAGYCALAVAEALPALGRVVAAEPDPTVARTARVDLDGSASGSKVDVRVGPVADTLHDLATAGERFDLVVVAADGDGYGDHLAAVLDGDLLTSHGVVVVDGTLRQGRPWAAHDRTADGDAVAVFNEMVTADPRLEQVLVPLGDGLTLIRRVAP